MTSLLFFFKCNICLFEATWLPSDIVITSTLFLIILISKSHVGVCLFCSVLLETVFMNRNSY